MNSGIKKIILFVVIVAVSYIAYQFMIKPANRSLMEQQARVNKKNLKLTELEKTTAAAKDLTEQLEQLQEAMLFFESKLPPTSEIHKVLEQVTIIAQKQGLQPKTIRTLISKENSGYVEQPLKMEVTGNFTSFYTFMLELEQLPRIMKIRELKINKITGTEGQISADFIVSIFFQNKVG